jgi:hypothetical protein
MGIIDDRGTSSDSDEISDMPLIPSKAFGKKPRSLVPKMCAEQKSSRMTDRYPVGVGDMVVAIRVVMAAFEAIATYAKL